MTRALLAAVVLAAVVAARPDPPPAGWPMLGGTPGRNMANPAAGRLPARFDPIRECRWTAELGGWQNTTQPVVAGGLVLVGTNNARPRNPRDTVRTADGRVEPLDRAVLMAFDTATGRLCWQALFDPPAARGVGPVPGRAVASTPAVVGDRVYVVSPAGVVTCLDLGGFADGNQGVQTETRRDPTDADVIWEVNVRRELKVEVHYPAASAPLVVGGRVFVCTGNGVDDGHENVVEPNAPSFVALEAATGRVLWTDSSPGREIMHGQWAGPAYAAEPYPQVVFPGGDGRVRAFDPPTGRLLWTFDGNPAGAVYKIDGSGTKTDFLAAPVVAGGRLYQAHGQQAGFDFPTAGGRFWCLDLTAGGRTPAAAWRAEPGRSNATACVVGGAVYLPDLAGVVHCYDAATGRRRWAYDTRGAVWGSAFAADGKVYVGNDAGELFVFRAAAGDAAEVLGTVRFPDSILATPAAADGVLYVVAGGRLYAIGPR